MQIARFWWTVVPAALVVAGLAWAADEKKAGAGDPKTDQPAEAKPAAVKIGHDAPDFTLLDCDGKRHKLSDHKDSVVALVWVNKECPWSRKANPVVKEVYEKYAGKGVTWLAIDSTYGRKAEEDDKYVDDEKLPFKILMDEDGKVGKLYGAKVTPHIYVINKGKLVYMGGLHNDQQGTKPKAEFRNYLDEALTAVLAGKDVPLAETTPWGCKVGYKDAGKGAGPAKDKP